MRNKKSLGRSLLSNSKEGMVVSSADDDPWETVGRKKKKSAITGTRSFVPSDLSAIFGGQLQSVVKAADLHRRCA
ncbi:hypothetical protein BDA96_06G050200 [Sorghum bicolor]|uniref:Uncharacterized protein n=1 Tax=Sorghum bicolor TaxID=4558 RepID=A0A921QRT9_SORBI|nr:hypothetical protein BDA96_06G050200 [Sorghum bicolor]